MDIKEPVLPLREYFAGLDSEVPIWLTCLRVNPGQLDRSDLIRIAQLRNLVVLDLSDDMSMDSKGTQIDERVFKTWAEMAQEGQAFKHLRALLLRGQAEVSGWIFNYLDHFPSLCFVVVSDCSQMHQKNRWEWIDQATSSGWEARHAKKSAKSLRSLIDDRNFYLGAVSGCYYHTKEAFDELANQKKSKLTDRVPVVEVWIGKPKPWLHLIEEFPGTRTVWFDNTKTREAARKAEARRKQEAPTMAKSARVKAAQLEEHTKRTRDMVSPSSDTKSPPPKRSMMMLRSRTRNLDQVMADFS